MDAARILIADDHPLFREALKVVCARLLPEADYVEAAGHSELLRATTNARGFDLAVIDLMMPGGEDLADLKALRARLPGTPIVVVSSREDRMTVRRVLGCGIAGFVPKSFSAAEMTEAIGIVLSGETFAPPLSEASDPGLREPEPLTPRQVAVLEALAHGHTNRRIAQDLGIEEITVKVHVSAILRKLHVKTRLEAVLASQSLGATF